MTSIRTVFETPADAAYRFPSTPGLGAALGQAPDPRLVVGPDQPIPGPSTPLPTTSQSNKKSNVQIPYTRVTADPTPLDEPNTLVFTYSDREAYTRWGATQQDRMDRVSAVDGVNREIASDPRAGQTDTRDWLHATYWRPDGFLLSTEDRAMDPARRDYLPSEERVSDSSALLVAIQGPTLVRNDFVTRPLIGDVFYAGLAEADDGTFSWFLFSSQQLDIVDPAHVAAINRPREPRRPIDVLPNTRRCRPSGFSRANMERLCLAYCLGRVVDVSPAPGCVTLDVHVWPVLPSQLGLRHDYNDERTPKDGPLTVLRKTVTLRYDAGGRAGWPEKRTYQVRTYVGFIGRRCKHRFETAVALAAPARILAAQCLVELVAMVREVREGVRTQPPPRTGDVIAYLERADSVPGGGGAPETVMAEATELDEDEARATWFHDDHRNDAVPSPGAPPAAALDDAALLAVAPEVAVAVTVMIKLVHCAAVVFYEYLTNPMFADPQVIEALAELTAILNQYALHLELTMNDEIMARLHTLVTDADWATVSSRTLSAGLARVVLVAAALREVSF
tara:strand:+ start:137 stop:1825 length:1689 start_codon:yes stop_codon:yes gene_type:complete